MPVIGALDKSHADIAKQLVEREASYEGQWNAFTIEEKALARTIAQIAMAEMGWPNDRFIPDDPFEIVIWDAGDGLATGSALSKIERVLRLAQKPESEWKDLATNTLGNVVKRLLSEAITADEARQ